MVRKLTKSRLYISSITCSWNPVMGTYYYSADGKRVPRMTRASAHLAIRLGAFVPGYTRVYACKDGIVRLVKSTQVLTWGSGSKTCYPVLVLGASRSRWSNV